MDRLDEHERAALPAVALIGARGFFTDANACIARAAWQRAPFREVAYAEDRLLAIDMLRAGFARAYVPDAAVVHSHAYTPAEELRRCFDEFRGLREVYGWREPLSPVHLARRLRGELGWARRELDRRGASPARAPRDARGGHPSPCRAPRRVAARLARRSTAGRRAAQALAGGALLVRAPRTSTRTHAADGNPQPDRLSSPLAPHVTRRPAPMSTHDPIQGRPEGAFSNLRRRIHLTYTHFGLRTILWRLLTFPLRFTPLHRRLRLRTHARDQERRRAAAWYREHGAPVDVVIPSYPRRPARAHARALASSAPRPAGWRA